MGWLNPHCHMGRTVVQAIESVLVTPIVFSPRCWQWNSRAGTRVSRVLTRNSRRRLQASTTIGGVQAGVGAIASSIKSKIASAQKLAGTASKIANFLGSSTPPPSLL